MRDLFNLTLTNIEQSDDTEYSPPLVGVMVTAGAGGDLTLVTEAGNTVVIALEDIAAGGLYPCTFWGSIKKIMATGTDIDDANIIGIKN